MDAVGQQVDGDARRVACGGKRAGLGEDPPSGRYGHRLAVADVDDDRLCEQLGGREHRLDPEWLRRGSRAEGRGRCRNISRRRQDQPVAIGVVERKGGHSDQPVAIRRDDTAVHQQTVAHTAVLPAIDGARDTRKVLRTSRGDVDGERPAAAALVAVPIHILVAKAHRPLRRRIDRCAVPRIPRCRPAYSQVVLSHACRREHCVGAAVAEAGHGLVAHGQEAKKGDERTAGPRILVQIVERAAKACPRVAACHRCAAPELTAAVERRVDRLSLCAPFDHIVLDTVRYPQRRGIVPAPGDKLHLVVLPAPDVGAVVGLQRRRPVPRRGDVDRQVVGDGSPLRLDIRTPIHAAAVARRGIVGHRLAGIGGGKDVGITQCKGKGPTGPHRPAENKDTVGVGSGAGRVAQQVVDHAQHALLGVVHNGVARGRCVAGPVVVCPRKAEPPRLALIDRVDAVDTPAVGVGVCGAGGIAVAIPAVQRHHHRHGRWQRTATICCAGRIDSIVVGVLKSVGDGGCSSLQTVEAVARVGRVKGDVPVAQRHVLNKNVAARIDGIDRNLDGQRVSDLFGNRARRVAGAKLCAILDALCHGCDGVVTGAALRALKINRRQRPHQQPEASRQRRRTFLDHKTRNIAFVPDAAGLHVVPIGVKTRRILRHVCVEQRCLCQVGSVDRSMVAIDTVAHVGARLLLPGEKGLPTAVQGSQGGRLAGRRNGGGSYLPRSTQRCTEHEQHSRQQPRNPPMPDVHHLCEPPRG